MFVMHQRRRLARAQELRLALRPPVLLSWTPADHLAPLARAQCEHGRCGDCLHIPMIFKVLVLGWQPQHTEHTHTAVAVAAPRLRSQLFSQDHKYVAIHSAIPKLE